MAKLSVQQVRERAKQIIQDSATGIRYSDLVQRIVEEHPETPINTVHGSIWDVDRRFPYSIHKPSRGLFLALQKGQAIKETVPPKLPREEEFYAPFANWLKNELDEVTEAVVIGGAGFQKKWGTPDVVGVYKPLASHRIKFDPEIVAVEIKVDPNQPVIAFGQAVTYRLFSAKSYVVIPNTMSPEDYGRLEALCMLFGSGDGLLEPDPLVGTACFLTRGECEVGSADELDDLPPQGHGGVEQARQRAIEETLPQAGQRPRPGALQRRRSVPVEITGTDGFVE